MAPKLHEFSVILQRNSIQTPWGIRLVGGSDLDTPLIITKVILNFNQTIIYMFIVFIEIFVLFSIFRSFAMIISRSKSVCKKMDNGIFVCLIYFTT